MKEMKCTATSAVNKPIRKERNKNIHSNLDIANKSVIPFLFTISNNSLYER